MSNVCRAYGEVCEYATEYGYCRLTACAKRSQTITVSKDKTVSYTNDVVEVVRCKDCIHWDRDTLKHQLNDFREWDEAECECLAERDGYNEVDHYVESDDYCSYGERKEK